VARTQYGDALAGVAAALAAQDVRHAIGDVRGRLAFADRRQSARPGRIRREPGARRIDHRIGADRLVTGAVAIAQLERSLGAALGLHLVEACARDAGHPSRGPDMVGKHCARCERLEIALDQLATGRVGLRVGRIPAQGFEQPQGSLVDGILPRREQPDMRPLTDRVTDRGAGFKHGRFEAAFEQMSCCGKADRTGADDCD
jgi:hypothetical protein